MFKTVEAKPLRGLLDRLTLRQNLAMGTAPKMVGSRALGLVPDARHHGLEARQPGSGQPDLSIVIPVNAQGDFPNVSVILGDIARYGGRLSLETILVVNNYPSGGQPPDVASFEALGVRVIAIPDVRRPGEAVGLSARIPGVRAARSEKVVLFDADCRIPNPTLLLDWYDRQFRKGAGAAYTMVRYHGLRRGASVRFRIAFHHLARWVKRTVLRIPTTRGSNYAVLRDPMLTLYDTGYIADEMNVGPAFKRFRGSVVYSGRPRLAVYTSGRMFNPGWWRIVRYFRYRLRYNLRVLPTRSDVALRTRRERDPIRRFAGDVAICEAPVPISAIHEVQDFRRVKLPIERSNNAGRVAYIMSRFPKLTETFVLNELRTLDALGARIELFPLLREKQDVEHPTVRGWVDRARFSPFLSLKILQANFHFLRHSARPYLRTWLEVVRGTWGSPNFLIGAIAIFPKVVRFAYEMRQEGMTHVHAHFATHPAMAAFIIHRLTGIPYSFTAHGSDLHVDRRMLDRKIDAAAFVIAISEYNKDVMVGECGEAIRPKVRVVHCGVDSDLFRPRAKPTRNWLSIVCVASFEEVKGHRYLIEACRLLRDRGIDYRCDLIGEGPTRRAIETRIRTAGLDDRVLVHGPRPSPEVARMVSESDLIVLASHPTIQGKREGIPVALMEGMACGLPVIATDISGIPELVEHGRTGLLVPPRDPVALADAIQTLDSDPVLGRRMGSAGRKKIQAEFDLAASGRTLLQMFTTAQHSYESAQKSPPRSLPERPSS